MASYFSRPSNVTIEINLPESEDRKFVYPRIPGGPLRGKLVTDNYVPRTIRDGSSAGLTAVDQAGRSDTTERFPVYFDGESVTGDVTIRLKAATTAPLWHNGINIFFCGDVLTYNDKGKVVDRFNLVKQLQELAKAGELNHTKTFPFNFRDQWKGHETYIGTNVRLVYYLRTVIDRRPGESPVQSDQMIWVHRYQKMPMVPKSSISMDIGFEDCLHIVVKYSRAYYSLQDAITGEVSFLLVSLGIQKMEVSIMRKEISGMPPDKTIESETVVKYEVMDGAPHASDVIPFRLFIQGHDLDPTYKDVTNRFSVQYFLHLALIDQSGRRFYKQSEFILFRTPPPETNNNAGSASAPAQEVAQQS